MQPENNTNNSIIKDIDDIEDTSDLINSISNLLLNEEILESKNSNNEMGEFDNNKMVIGNQTKLKGGFSKIHSNIIYHTNIYTHNRRIKN